MKKIVMSIIVLLIIGLAYLAIEGRRVQEIRTEIEIAASPDKVWSVLMDINKWQEWSPIINQSSGKVAVGSKINITMAGSEDGKDGPKYSPSIINLDKAKNLHWRAHMLAGFIFTNDKVFELEAIQGGTRLVHKELFSGMLAPIFCGKMKESVSPMLDSMNLALKELVEKI